jgi:hypothetical protein
MRHPVLPKGQPSDRSLTGNEKEKGYEMTSYPLFTG